MIVRQLKFKSQVFLFAVRPGKNRSDGENRQRPQRADGQAQRDGALARDEEAVGVGAAVGEESPPLNPLQRQGDLRGFVGGSKREGDLPNAGIDHPISKAQFAVGAKLDRRQRRM